MGFAHPVTRFFPNGVGIPPPSRVVSYGRARAIRIFAAVLACTVLLLTVRHYPSKPPPPSIYDYTDGRTSLQTDRANITYSDDGRPEENHFLSHLVNTHGLSNKVTWYSRRVQSSYSSSARLSVTDVSSAFLRNGFSPARADDKNLVPPVKKSLKLPFTLSAKSNEVDASALLFGISTSYSRLTYANNSLIKDWERWLTDGKGSSNGASLVLTLHNSNKDEVAHISRALEVLGIDAVVRQSAADGDAASRYVELLHLLRSQKEATAEGGGNAKSYFALADDDVFFPSLSKLLRKLSRFPPAEEHYIGAPSERSDWVVENNQTLTGGGGAVFLTLPMAEKLAALPCLQQRSGKKGETSWRRSGQWDFALYDCATTFTSPQSSPAVRLRVLPSYYDPSSEDDQDPSGDGTASSYEGYGGGIQPLTLHHYKNWHRFEAGRGHTVASVCGEDCFLQRFLFADGWVLVNGYAISQYPDGVDALPAARRKAKLVVQDSSDEAETHGPAVSDSIVIDKPDLPGDPKVIAWRGRKRTWRLLDARVLENGEVWQAYIKKKEGGNWPGDVQDRLPDDPVHSEEEKSDLDSVILLIWEP